LYPEYADLIDGQRDLITIHHMLAMCSGLDWDESTYEYDDPLSHTYQLLFGDDPIRFVLTLPIIEAPETSFLYNSGTTNVLGDLVRKTSGLLLTEFAQQYLFQPLGIEEFLWLRCDPATDVTFASGGLYLRPRDMAKLGQLYLQEGLWNSEQIVSTNWVQASTTESIPMPASMVEPYHSYGYGYQWWLERFNSGALDAYSARGWGSQYIVVLPGVDLVVVFTGGAFESTLDVPMLYYDIIQDYILPSVN
jgi:CubicO group peptidase (beta-lactamase class C family)